MAPLKHGLSNDIRYSIFRGMNSRCLDESADSYFDYGGRGITVCDRWHRDTPNSLQNFLSDMGERPSSQHSIDRIDNNGNYDPTNCRWATAAEQQNNRRVNKLVSYMGRTQTAAQWGRELSVNPTTITTRLSRGWTDAQSLGLDKRPAYMGFSYNGRTQTSVQWGKELGIKECLIRERVVKLGWTHAQALGFDKRPTMEILLTYQGRSQNPVQWGKELGVKPGTIRSRSSKGWTDAQALGFERMPIKKSDLTYQGRTQTTSQWGRELGVHHDTIRGRVRLGWTDAQALGFEKRE